MLVGYLFLDKDLLSGLVTLKKQSSTPLSYYRQVALLRVKYAATNIFDKGYRREIGSDLYQRLSVFPKGELFTTGSYSLLKNAPEGIVKLALPKGFKDGVLGLIVKSQSEFVISVSSDLKIWSNENFKGSLVQATYCVGLEKNKVNENSLYLKFTSSSNEEINIIFDTFQYVSTIPNQEKAYYGYFFFPDTKISDSGEKIIEPAVIYDDRKN